jgi:hypothetical protein
MNLYSYGEAIKNFIMLASIPLSIWERIATTKQQTIVKKIMGTHAAVKRKSGEIPHFIIFVMDVLLTLGMRIW